MTNRAEAPARPSERGESIFSKLSLPGVNEHCGKYFQQSYDNAASFHNKETIMGQNYFNTLNLQQKLDQLGRCRFMDRSEFASEAEFLKGKKVVIVGCGAQGCRDGSDRLPALAGPT